MNVYRGPLPPLLPWQDPQPLLTLGGDPWRIKDACEGVMIFGGTGSGKTSGSGRALATAYLDAGFGGLVLCAKPEEPELWCRYAAQTGRSADLIRFGPDNGYSFNFMDYECRRPGAGAGLTENLVNLFIEVSGLGMGASGGGGSDAFWERAMKSLVRNCVDLLLLSGETVSLPAMFEVIRSAAPDLSQVGNEKWEKDSYCAQCVETARHRSRGTAADADCGETIGFWLKQFPALGDKTRSSLVATFTTLAESLTRGKMRDLFCRGTTLTPESALAGRIIVVDLPVKEWAEIGRLAAVLWKYTFQKAVERRAHQPGQTPRPVFLWADECQSFASRYDTLFQATARSSRAATVYLTQNYPSLLAALGGEREGRAVVDALLGNLGTKIFHANSDRDTNQFAADLVGRRRQVLRNGSGGMNVSFGGSASLGTSSQHGAGEHMDYEIQPREFTGLRKGGPENAFAVEAMVFQNGRTWRSTDRTWQKIAFRQTTPARGRQR
jgi:hypothetical protein